MPILGHLIFYKKNISTPRTILALEVVSHFSNKCSSAVYTKSALDLVGQFFVKMMLGDISEWVDKKISRGGGIYHGWCNDTMSMQAWKTDIKM